MELRIWERRCFSPASSTCVACPAGKVLVEAGGLVTRFDGAPLRLAGNEIAASGPGLHAAMLEVLREARATWPAVPLPSAR